MTSPRLPGDLVEFIVIGALVLFSLLSLDFFSDVAAFYPSCSVLVPLLRACPITPSFDFS